MGWEQKNANAPIQEMALGWGNLPLDMDSSLTKFGSIWPFHCRCATALATLENLHF